MPTFTVYNSNGETVGTVEQPELFQVEVDTSLIHRYVTWVRTMLRQTLAHTKTRGEVSGGGKKPWKQKGTGRARIGSTRAPHWRHGGTAFGPRKEQTWATRLPRGERRKALFSSLSAKAQAGQVIVLDEWHMDTPKTKTVVELLSKLPIEKQSVLHVHSTFDKVLFASTHNLPKVDSTTLQNMNIIDIVNHDVVLLTKSSLQDMANHFIPAS